MRSAPALLALALLNLSLVAMPADAQAQTLTWRFVENAPDEPQRPLYLVRQLSDKRFCGAWEDTPNYGRIRCTGDGGATWTFSSVDGSANATYLVRALWFLPSNTMVGWAGTAGYQGEVLRTTDGGATWTNLGDEMARSPGGAPPIHWVEPLSETTAFAAGAYDVFLTRDAGKTWDDRTGPDMGGAAFAMFDMVDEANGFAANSTNLFKTTDGAKTWSSELLPWNKPGAIPLILGMRAVDASTVVAMVVAAGETDAKLWRTSDSGETWTTLSSQPQALSPVRKLGAFTFVGARYYVGGAGYIASSADGKSWSVEYNDTAAPHEVRFRDPLGPWSGGPGLPFAWAASQGYYEGYYVKDAPAPPTPTSPAATPTVSTPAAPPPAPTASPSPAPTPGASPGSPATTPAPTAGGEAEAPGPALALLLAAALLAALARRR